MSRYTRGLRKAVITAAALGVCSVPVAGFAAGSLPAAAPGAMMLAQAGNAMVFDIPKQDLNGALMEFATQAGIQIFYDTEIPRSLIAPPISGRYTAEEALDHLLEDTGLTYVFTSARTVTVISSKPAPNSSERDRQSARLGVMTVRSTAEDYRADHAASVARMDLRSFDVPVAVQVVPQEVIRDQQAVKLEEITKNVSGVQKEWSYGGLYEGFSIRGFAAGNHVSSPVHRNGFRLHSQGIETANVERVEVVKGPSSVAYGRIEPGGLINLITKMPMADRYTALQVQGGSESFLRATLDTTGSFDERATVLYRLNLAHTDTDSFRDLVGLERTYVAPTLLWKIRPDTQISVAVEYKDEFVVHDNGIPAVGDRPAPIPISRNFGEREMGSDIEQLLIDVNLIHDINDAWTIRGGYIVDSLDNVFEDLFTGPLDPDNRTLNRGVFFADADNEYSQIYIDFQGKFRALGMNHNVLVGADYYRRDLKQAIYLDDGTPIDILDPVYGTLDFNALRQAAPNFLIDDGDKLYGIYVQDQIEVTDKVKVLAGMRFDKMKRIRGTLFGFFPPPSFPDIVKTTVENDEFSPRVGVMYQPLPWLGLYGSYAESFGPTNGLSPTGEAFDPQRGSQAELGAKMELLGGDLSVSFAIYDLTQENLLTADPANPPFRAPLGEANSKGFEVDVEGRVSDTLRLRASYSYIDASITENNDGLRGNTLPNAAKHSGGLWARYDVIPERLVTGLGVFALSQRQGDNQNSFQLPGYARVDAFGAYTWQLNAYRVTAQLNINNILDRQYYQATNLRDGIPRANIMPGAPRTVLASLKAEF